MVKLFRGGIVAALFFAPTAMAAEGAYNAVVQGTHPALQACSTHEYVYGSGESGAQAAQSCLVGVRQGEVSSVYSCSPGSITQTSGPTDADGNKIFRVRVSCLDDQGNSAGANYYVNTNFDPEAGPSCEEGVTIYADGDTGEAPAAICVASSEAGNSCRFTRHSAMTFWGANTPAPGGWAGDFTSNGEECRGDEGSYSGSHSPGSPPEVVAELPRKKTTETQNDFPENGCMMDGNGVETCVDTSQTTTTESGPGTVTWDGQTFTYEEWLTKQSTTTETETTVTQPDGSSSTTTTRTTHTSGGGYASGSSSGGTTSSGGGSSTSTSTSVVNRDAEGNITDSTSTEEDSGADEADASGYGNSDWGDFDEAVKSWEGSPDLTGVDSPAGEDGGLFSFGGSSSCNPQMFSGTVMGISFSPNPCPAINTIQEILYWFVVVLTGWFIWESWTGVVRRG